jgi:hypothetical protein
MLLAEDLVDLEVRIVGCSDASMITVCELFYKRVPCLDIHANSRSVRVLKFEVLEIRFIHNKLEAILFEEMRRIDLLWEVVKYKASLL